MTARIRWEETPLGSLAGHVGTIDGSLFSIWIPPQATGEWVLTSELPGTEGRRCYGDEPEGLKAEAERWLEEFAASLGVVFPGAPSPQQPLTAEGGVTCSAVVVVDEEDAYPCGATSWFRVERSDGDTSYGINGGSGESCDEHLAECVAGMIDGDQDVRAIVAIRWDMGDDAEAGQ